MKYSQNLFRVFRYVSLVLVVAVGLATIVGTGGNGGSGNGNGDVSPGGYTGETSQARISESNAMNIAASAFKKQQSAGRVSDAYTPTLMGSQKTSGIPLASQLSPDDIEEDSSEETQACSYGGKILAEETTREEGYDVISTVYVDFMNCNQDNVTTIDGEARAEIVLTCLDYDPQWEMCTHYSMNMKMEFIEITADDGERSETLTGTFEMADEPGDDQIMMVMTKDILVKDNDTKKTYKMYDMVGRVYQDAEYGVATEAEGRFYHHEYGYVDIYTKERLRLYAGDMYPSEGEYVIEGANGTEARVFFLDNETFRVRADTSGNGVYDYDSGIIYWSGISNSR